MIAAKNISLGILLLLATTICSLAQSPNNPKIMIGWEVSKNNYNQTGQTLSEFSIKNLETSKFMASDWDIYFNSPAPKLLDDSVSNVNITHINGDFFKLSPGKSFKGIAPQQTLTIKILTRTLKNVTDYPKGFYIVFADAPLKPISLEVVIKSAVDYRPMEKILANQTFLKNELVEATKADDLSPILPTPKSYQYLKGSFNLTAKVKIVSLGKFKSEANYLASQLKTVLGTKPAIAESGKENIILFTQNKSLPAGGYKLDITPKKVVITAADNSGLFYGIQSLKNLLPSHTWKTKASSISLRSISISDAPRFPHRAFMMDIARNFQPKAQIMKTLDVLALYKMNVLHLHFNDDEGWRIEIKGLPELTEVGSKRGHTLTELDHLIPSYGSGPFTTNTFGSGYLSRSDFIEILKFAKERHITVIPEFETPGHARAAIKAMDARYHRLMKEGKSEEATKYLLRDLDDQSKYESVQGFRDNIINPALPSVYNFIEKITDETIAMYKEAGAALKTIHFGGDEVPNGVWEQSPIANALVMQDSSVTSIDDLWQFYFSKVNGILKARNLYLSGWEEIGLKKAVVDGRKTMVLDNRFKNENYHTDVWNNLAGNEDLAYKLANAGYKVVLTNVTNMYLDLAYNKSHEEIGQYWGGYVDVDKPFKFIPLNYYKNQHEDRFGAPLPKDFYQNKDTLSTLGEANIIGLQAPLWSEIITSKERLEYLLFPKLLGVAERSWAQNPDWAIAADSAKSAALYLKDWSRFVNLIGIKELGKLDHYAGGFSYRIPPIGYIVEDNKVKANVLYPGLTIRYTEDGKEPTIKSNIYKPGISFKENIKMKVFNKENRSGETILIIKD